MSNGALKSRVLWPDLIRACAIALVVGVHVSGVIMNAGFYSVKPVYWWVAAVVNGVGRCGVPMFFMISGALLLGKAQEPVSVFFKKRASRIAVAFIVWSIAYLLLRWSRHQVSLTPRSFLNILTTPVYYHLWFFYSIIGLYLVVPLLRFASESGLKYVSLLWLVTIPVMFMVSRWTGFTINGNFCSILPTYIGYLTIGYILSSRRSSPKMLAGCCCMFVVSALISVAGTGYLTIHNNGMLNGFLFDYLSLNVVAMSISLFILLREAGSRDWPMSAQIRVQSAGACGLGIFVMHPMLLEFFSHGIWGVRLSPMSIDPLIGLPLTFVAVMLCSWGITFIMLKIPVLRMTV